MSAARVVRHAKRDRSPSAPGAGDALPDVHHASQFSIGAGTPTASAAAVNDSCAASKKCSPHLPDATIPIVSSVGDQITAVVSTPELPADDLRAVALIAASPRPPRPNTKPAVSASPVPSGAPLWATRVLPRQPLAHLPDTEDEDGTVRSVSAVGGDDGVRGENCGASPRPASCDYSPRSAMASVSRSSSGSSWGDEGWGMSSAMTGFGHRQQRSSPAPTAALAAFRKGPGFVHAFGPRPWASSQENSNSNTVTDPSSQFQHVPVSSGVTMTRARSASATVRFSSALELRHAGWDSTPCQQTAAGLAVEPPRLVRSKYFVARRSSDGALIKIPGLDATLSTPADPSLPHTSQPGAQRGRDCCRALVFSQTSSDDAAQLSSASQGSNRATNRGVSNIFPAWPCPTYSLHDDHAEHTMGRDMKHRFSSSRSRSVEHHGRDDSQTSSIHVNGGCEGLAETSCLRAVPSSVAAAIATVPTEFTTARGSPWRVTAAALKFAKDQFAQIEIQHSPLRSPQAGDGSCDKNGVSLVQRQPRSAQPTAMLHGRCTDAPPKARGADYNPYDLTGTSTVDEDDAVSVEGNGGWRHKRSAAIGTDNARVGIDHQKNLADLADCVQRTRSAPLRPAVSHNSQGIDSEPFTCCQPKATATAAVPHSPVHREAEVVCDESSGDQSFFDKPAAASRKQQLRRKRHRAADEDDSSPSVPDSSAASVDGVQLNHCEDEGSSGGTVASMASKGPLMEDRMLSPRHYTVPDGFETHPSEETVGHPAVLAQSSHYVGFTTAGGRMLCLRRNIRGAYG